MLPHSPSESGRKDILSLTPPDLEGIKRHLEHQLKSKVTYEKPAPSEEELLRIVIETLKENTEISDDFKSRYLTGNQDCSLRLTIRRVVESLNMAKGLSPMIGTDEFRRTLELLSGLAVQHIDGAIKIEGDKKPRPALPLNINYVHPSSVLPQDISNDVHPAVMDAFDGPNPPPKARARILGSEIERLDSRKLDEDKGELEQALFELRQAARQNISIQVRYRLHYDYRKPAKYKDFPTAMLRRLDGSNESVNLFGRNAELLREIEAMSHR